MKARRTYKDSLFRDIFNDKKRLQGIYYALTGEKVAVKDIKITTLRGTFFEDIKNDISFMVGNRHIVLMEHQSTLSENMPLRMLWYI
ncbi:MAG: transposase, partial [Anaerovibrio sp.]|nr:transposase [Anaerovibrio sp.]